MKKINIFVNKVKNFFDTKVTFGDYLFWLIIIFSFLFYVFYELYFEPIERYLYIEHGVFHSKYSDYGDCFTEKYYEDLEEYKKSLEETGDKK